ncbi:hypothetical protein [Trichothermofontia sp.]
MIELDSDESIKLAIALPLDVIQTFCQRWQIADLVVFGSILLDDFVPIAISIFCMTSNQIHTEN